MTSIQTLIPDIYRTISKKDGWFTPEIAAELGHEISIRLQSQLGETRQAPSLRLSQMGPRCPKALWHSIHTPGEAEPLQPWAEIKYSYGHIVEALAIALAKGSGHLVTGEQDAVTVDGITGHRDCVIDGCIVDVKSTTSLGFGKFKNGTIKESDLFGYLDQLDGYMAGSLEDPLVSTKDRAYLLAVEKEKGHMCLYEHHFRETHIRERIASYRRIVAEDRPPVCNCKTVSDGESGNIKLDTRASYDPFKFCCFPHLRIFLYSDGPRFLTKVVRRPYDVKKKRYIPEIDRLGNIVYN